MNTSLTGMNHSTMQTEQRFGTSTVASMAAALAMTMTMTLVGCVVDDGGEGDLEQTHDISSEDAGDAQALSAAPRQAADPVHDVPATEDATAPATLAGKTLETAKVKCPYWANGTYYDDYDNNPNDYVVGTGYRAYANECQLKPGQYGATVRLVTSCSYGFTYYSEWKTFYSGWIGLESPSQSTTGCVFGVADYWLEQQ
jgi:hypothetical protein